MYSPKLRDDLIPRLYRLGKTLDVPMTRLASVLLELGIRELEQALERLQQIAPDSAPPRRPRKHVN